MCFHFCVLPCFPWLLPVLTIGALAQRDRTLVEQSAHRRRYACICAGRDAPARGRGSAPNTVKRTNREAGR